MSFEKDERKILSDEYLLYQKAFPKNLVFFFLNKLLYEWMNKFPWAQNRTFIQLNVQYTARKTILVWQCCPRLCSTSDRWKETSPQHVKLPFIKQHTKAVLTIGCFLRKTLPKKAELIKLRQPSLKKDTEHCHSDAGWCTTCHFWALVFVFILSKRWQIKVRWWNICFLYALQIDLALFGHRCVMHMKQSGTTH